MSSRSALLGVDPYYCECRAFMEKELKKQDDFKNALAGEPNYPIKTIKPVPGFCMKSKEVETAIKVFVNICHADEIPPPEEISENTLIDFLNSYCPTNYKIPMSIGKIQPVIDNKGNVAKKIDIAISSKFYAKMETNGMFHSFLVASAFQGIREKYQLLLDCTKTLKNRKAYGELQLHRIKQHESAEKMGVFKFQQKSSVEEMKPGTSKATENAS